MSNKQKHDTYVKGKRLENCGIDANPKRDRIHANERPIHVAVRYLCGYVLQKFGRSWDVEVEIPGGDRIDVIDYGDFDEQPLAIEIESSPDRKSLESKVKRYVKQGPCRDIVVIDLRKAPETIDEIVTWLETEIPGP